MIVRKYSELSRLDTFDERFKYLKLCGEVGKETFGFDRFLNQVFYKSAEWKSIRDFVIVRDNGCDLGVDGYDIYGKILVHHINPISQKDIETKSEFLLNPEYLITTTHSTHNAIHYGDENLLVHSTTERSKNDTCPWRK
ncbi:hypothetical protein FACS1894132_11210 [Clostridia bacterium]|nr:hypothetical protein FACS1894132_11210 [Clostridia bacterium]